MVLVITTVLGALAADLSNETNVNLRAATNARDELQAYYHARSAIELELFVLRFQGMLKAQLEGLIPIPLFEFSGYLVSSDTMKGIIDRDGPRPTDEAKKDTFAIDKPFGDFEGSFWIEDVVDENRKINLNPQSGTGVGCQNVQHLMIGAIVDNPKYDPLFEQLGDSRDPIRNRIELISNITDWADGNEDVDPVCIITQDRTSGGSEDTRYGHLPYGANYKPKNGMFDSVAELRMLPYVGDAFMQLFSRYFTVWSDSRVSMKTADPWMVRAVVRAISVGPPLPGDEEKFAKFMEQRALLTAVPGVKFDKAMFVSLLAFADIPFDQAKLDNLAGRVITFDDVSSVYRITAVGRVNGASSSVTVVWRDDRTGKLSPGQFYYWREE